MKVDTPIKYSIFQSRRKFNPLSLFFKNKDLTYDQFVDFLRSKMVESPGEEYFQRVKSRFEEMIMQEEKPVEEVKQVVEETIVEQKHEPSRQKRRGRRNKKLDLQEEKLSAETKEELQADEKDSIE